MLFRSSLLRQPITGRQANLLNKVSGPNIDNDVLRVLYSPRDVKGGREGDEDLLVWRAQRVSSIAQTGLIIHVPLFAGLIPSTASMHELNFDWAALRFPNAWVRCLSS